MAPVQRVWQSPGEEERLRVSCSPRQEGGDSSSRLAWHVSLEDKLWQLPQPVPCGLFFKSEDGGIW